MTTTRLVQHQIERFLRSTTPEVLCVHGEWGVGKTFLWHKILSELEDIGAVELKNYSYVSLFGINSLDGLKMSIFENSRSTLEGTGPVSESLTKRWSALSLFSKKHREFAEVLPWIGEALSKAGPLYFSTVKEQIVCIDDLERRSDDLDIRDVLGLVSFLKEQRKCKIAFLLNNDEVQDGDGEFSRYFEKVFDIKVTFAPTPAESATIALSQQDSTSTLLEGYCVSLGISNIRVIKKIERLVREIEPLLRRYHHDITRQAVSSVALLGWSCYQPNLAPSLEYLRAKGSAIIGARKGDEFAREDARWGGFLAAYGFQLVDELDLELLKALESGCIDKQGIEKAASDLDMKLKLSDQDNVFNAAWSLFHDNFDNNEIQLVEALCSAFKQAVQTISPMNCDGTIRLLRELGKDQEAEALIKYYVENRGDHRGIWDLESHPFGANVQDAAVRKAFSDKLASLGSGIDPLDVLKNIGARGGWNPEEISALASLPVSEYHRILKSHRGEDLSRIIKSLFMFDRTVNQSPEMIEMTKRARQALAMIGAESTVNKIRVARLGIHVDPPPATEDRR